MGLLATMPKSSNAQSRMARDLDASNSGKIGTRSYMSGDGADAAPHRPSFFQRTSSTRYSLPDDSNIEFVSEYSTCRDGSFTLMNDFAVYDNSLYQGGN
jgi:hypothetical protein